MVFLLKINQLISEKTRLRIGKYKSILNRLISYLGILNFSMLLYIFVKNQPLGFNWFIWFITVIFLCLGIMIFDIFFVIKAESIYLFKKNPKLVEMNEKLDTIINLLDMKK